MGQRNRYEQPHQRRGKRRRRRGSGRTLLLGVIAIPVVVVLCAALLLTNSGMELPFAGAGSAASQPSAPRQESGEASVPSTPAAPQEITLLGAGDNMQHSPMLDACKTDTGYDFQPIYTQIKPTVEAADLAFVNQEMPCDPSVEPSGYPLFNAAPEMCEALVDTGFDVISEANNHMLDQGASGLQATIDYWKTQPGILQVGAYEDEADLETPHIVEKNGFKVAYLAVTEMTNGYTLPADSPLCILYTSETDTIERLIKAAKAQADIVVVSAHWGTEDTFELTDAQTTLAQQMVDWGADVIFGNHPHALQELTTLTRASDGATCPVIYAFGNLISTQYDPWNLVSGLLSITYARDESGKAVYQGMRFQPIVTYYEEGGENIHVVWLKDFTLEMAQQSRTWSRTGGQFTPDYAKSVVEQSIPAQYQDWS